MSKEELLAQFAAAALTGILANPQTSPVGCRDDSESYVHHAYKIARQMVDKHWRETH